MITPASSTALRKFADNQWLEIAMIRMNQHDQLFVETLFKRTAVVEEKCHAVSADVFFRLVDHYQLEYAPALGWN